MKKVLSVIIPVYNMERYIRQCLDSLVIESIMDKLEVLIVLDGSTDHSIDIAREYVEKYPCTFRVMSKANGGHGSTINTGMMMATGTYVKVLDSDDWVERDAFVHLVQYLEETDADIVWSNFYWVYEQNGKKDIQNRHPFAGVSYGKKYDFSQISEKTFIKMHSMTIRTEAVRQAGMKIDENCYYVDVEFVMYPIPQVKTIVFLDEFVYMYRLGRQGQSMTLEKMRKNHKNHERVLTSLLDFYQEQRFRKADQAYLLYLEHGIANVLSSHFKIYLSFPCSREICKRLRQMDGGIREEYPEIYNKVTNKFVWAIRKSGYFLYYPGHFLMRLREKKNEL
nr:glycosyltransferase family 2 protein [uncultured Blautia sp.]